MNEEELEWMFKTATFYDDAKYYHTEEYEEIARKQYCIWNKFTAIYGAEIWPLLEEFLSTINDEMRYERKQAFRLGYQTAKAEGQGGRSRPIGGWTDFPKGPL